MINIRIYLFLLCGTLIFSLLLREQGSPLTTSPFSPRGIIDLELAKSIHQTEEVVAGWKVTGMLWTARKNILLDFLFIPFYSLLFYTLCGSISVRVSGTISKLGVLLAFSSFIAAVLDVFENILMLLSLSSFFSSLVSLLTFVLAVTKFFLLAVAVVYVIIFGLKLIIAKLSGVPSHQHGL